jgi:hypothetical protein
VTRILSTPSHGDPLVHDRDAVPVPGSGRVAGRRRP